MKKHHQIVLLFLAGISFIFTCNFSSFVFAGETKKTLSVEERLANLEKEIDRLNAVNEIKKVMGRYDAFKANPSPSVGMD